MLLVKKTRMVQLLVELLSNKIVFPFASEIIGAAEEMQKKCEEREEGEDSEMNKLWESLDDVLTSILKRAKKAGIQARKKEDEDKWKDRIKELEEAVQKANKEKEEAIKAKDRIIKEKEEALEKEQEAKDRISKEKERVIQAKEEALKAKDKIIKEKQSALQAALSRAEKAEAEKGRVKRPEEHQSSKGGEKKEEEGRIVKDVGGLFVHISNSSIITRNGNTFTHNGEKVQYRHETIIIGQPIEKV